MFEDFQFDILKRTDLTLVKNTNCVLNNKRCFNYEDFNKNEGNVVSIYDYNGLKGYPCFNVKNNDFGTDYAQELSEINGNEKKLLSKLSFYNVLILVASNYIWNMQQGGFYNDCEVVIDGCFTSAFNTMKLNVWNDLYIMPYAQSMCYEWTDKKSVAALLSRRGHVFCDRIVSIVTGIFLVLRLTNGKITAMMKAMIWQLIMKEYVYARVFELKIYDINRYQVLPWLTDPDCKTMNPDYNKFVKYIQEGKRIKRIAFNEYLLNIRKKNDQQNNAFFL